MTNPLAITELLAEVLKNLDTKELVAVSYVNKTWRLEAKKILYKDRSNIIYCILGKVRLNELRLRSSDLYADLLSIIPIQEFVKLGYFIHIFSLDFKTELLSIRNQFRAEHKRLKKICKILNDEVIRHSTIEESYDLYGNKFWVARRNHDERYKKYLIAKTYQFENWRNMINYEYFLTRFAGTSVLTEDEIDIIIDKLQPLRDEEEERRWSESANSIFEYWGDEDPDSM
jgi:F-box domain